MSASPEERANSSAADDRAGAFAYETPQAFGAALKAQFTRIAAADPRYTVDELQRQFAYDRVLARCFTDNDADRWVLKGAGALLARLDRARHSLDIDLYFAGQPAKNAEAIAALRRVLARDLGDHFQFEISKIVSLPDAAKGSRCHPASHAGT